MKRKFRYRRTAEIKITNEARVLRQLRLNAGLSIREVGRRLGKSEAYVRHIENGRSNIPASNALEDLLRVYDISFRSFKLRVKRYKEEVCLEVLMTKLKSVKKENYSILYSILVSLS